MKHILEHDDSHWYVIPADKGKEFEAWVATEGEEPKPEWARPVGGSPTRVVFGEYEIR